MTVFIDKRWFLAAFFDHAKIESVDFGGDNDGQPKQPCVYHPHGWCLHSLNQGKIMTPAINVAKNNKISHTIHQYQHDPSHTSFGLEAAEVLGMAPEKVFKTLLFCLNGEPRALAVAILPVDHKLNLKLAAKAAGAKKADMADPDIAQKTTGYVVGGISPLGQKKLLPTFIHESALLQETICVSAGKRGLEIELTPQDLAALTHGRFELLCV